MESLEQAYVNFTPSMLSNDVSTACPYATPGLEPVSACSASLDGTWSRDPAFSCNVSFGVMGVVPSANRIMVRYADQVVSVH